MSFFLLYIACKHIMRNRCVGTGVLIKHFLQMKKPQDSKKFGLRMKRFFAFSNRMLDNETHSQSMNFFSWFIEWSTQSF